MAFMSDESTPAALAGAVSGLRVMQDGTVRVTLDFEPKDREHVMRLMGAPGQPVGVAALRHGFAAKEAKPEVLPLGPLGPLCREAGSMCRVDSFQEYVSLQGPWPKTSDSAADYIRAYCGVESRRDLDGNEEAAGSFADLRRQYLRWRVC